MSTVEYFNEIWRRKVTIGVITRVQNVLSFKVDYEAHFLNLISMMCHSVMCAIQLEGDVKQKPKI